MDDVYLPAESQRALIRLSRETLNRFVLRGKAIPAEIQMNDAYLQARDFGAFVSLHRSDELRGCIGNCAPRTPLYETVMHMTEAAAAEDRRVKPISADELDDIDIEITVLSPLFSSADPLALDPAKHGLHVARAGRRGVLLPQVPIRYGWNMETFLEQTCVKAGLAKDDWKKPDTEVSAFSVLIIEEKQQ
jgi:uncharacterized protein